MRTSQKTPEAISTIGIDVGKNTFHLVGLDKRGAIVLQQKVSDGLPRVTIRSLSEAQRPRASPRGKDCSSTATFRRGRASSRTARQAQLGRW